MTCSKYHCKRVGVSVNGVTITGDICILLAFFKMLAFGTLVAPSVVVRVRDRGVTINAQRGGMQLSIEAKAE